MNVDPHSLPFFYTRDEYMNHLDALTVDAFKSHRRFEEPEYPFRTFAFETAHIDHHCNIMLHSDFLNPMLLDPYKVLLYEIDSKMFRVEDATPSENRVLGLLEIINERYFLFYTALSESEGYSFFREAIEYSSVLEQVWVPKPLIESSMQNCGVAVLDDGIIIPKHSSDASQITFEKYRTAMIRALEAHKAATEQIESAMRDFGKEIVTDTYRKKHIILNIRFSKKLTDNQFAEVAQLGLNKRKNMFRLTGYRYLSPPVPNKLKITWNAVDTHLWQPFQIQIDKKGMTAILHSGICGNSVNRLIRNWQIFLGDANVETKNIYLGSQTYDDIITSGLSSSRDKSS